MPTAIDRLDPQRNFVGCLLHLTADAARRLLAGMCADDFSNYMAGHVTQLIIEVIALEQNPDPAVVFAHAITTKKVASSTQIERLAIWLAEAYHDAPTVPSTTGAYLKAIVLENAWRNALREYAARLLHGITTSPTDIVYSLSENTDRIIDLWQRYTTCTSRNPAEAVA